MATVSRKVSSEEEPLELHNGDLMTRAEFHRIYERMPEDFRAELIGGIVYVAPPVKLRHGTNHLPLGTLFFAYEGNTPGWNPGTTRPSYSERRGSPSPTSSCACCPSMAYNRA
jgi:hypothetical protein